MNGTVYWASCMNCRSVDGGHRMKVGFFDPIERDMWVTRHTEGPHIVEQWDEQPTFPLRTYCQN